MLERWVHADHLSVRLGVHQAGEAVAGVAADTLALGGGFIEHDAEWSVKRPEAQGGEIIAEQLHPRLVTNGRTGIWSLRRGLGWICTPPAVNVVELLRLRVIRLQVFIGDRPGG